MANWFILFPVYFGFAAVFQAGLNRQIASHLGLSSAAALNSVVLALTALILFFFTKMSPQNFPELFRPKSGLSSFSWWYALPGLLGFSLVLGIPIAIQRLGALKVFLGIIGAQMIASLIWDSAVENIPLSSVRVLGTLAAFLSAAVVVFKG